MVVQRAMASEMSVPRLIARLASGGWLAERGRWLERLDRTCVWYDGMGSGSASASLVGASFQYS